MDESLPYRISYSVGLEKCKKCRHKIDAGHIQIAIMVQSNENDCKYPIWYHQECFFKVRLPATEAAFDGFPLLRYAHQMAVRNDLGIGIQSENKELEDQIRIQNEEYFEIYKFVKNVSYGHRKAILSVNEQMMPAAVNRDESKCIHHVTDLIYFGALPKCQKCGQKQLVFSNWTYKCSFESDWSMCGNEVKEPERSLAIIPDEILKLFTTFPKTGVRTRRFHPFRMFDEHGNDIVYGPYKRPPLFNMELVLVGEFSQPRADIERQIKRMGGKVESKVHSRVAAIISNKHEIEKMDKPMRDARMHDIQVVSEDFLNETQSPDVDPIGYILSESICDWGGDPYDRIPENDVASRMETVFYEESMPKKITYKWKGGGAVDPECGLGDNVHVYTTNKNGKDVYYSVVLAFVDIQTNKNSYHRLQLLESNGQNGYWVFESWGRIGTVIGSKKLETCPTFCIALKKFCSTYESKTDNKFAHSDYSPKQPNKFYHLDVEAELPLPKKTPEQFFQTNLSKPVYDLMELLFDITKVESTMIGCELDLREMPLGKISANQMKMAMATLQQIEQLIQQNATVHELLAMSNKFYTLISHAFGINRPPIIDSIEAVTAKHQMLESLLNVDIIHGFLDAENVESVHPFDLCYTKLNASIVPIEKHTVLYRQLCDALYNTGGKKWYGSYNTLEVLEIFKVQREAEIDHGNSHINWKLRNHQLLWHGSRLLNFATIISNGLKIAPTEALGTGKRYGNGIYFADAAAKSALFCYPDATNNVGLMLLCEVALGISNERARCSYGPNASLTIGIPNDEHQSIKALGRIAPNQYQAIEGVRIACGALEETESQEGNDYNEFIVFDPNQVKIRYLFKIQFNYGNSQSKGK